MKLISEHGAKIHLSDKACKILGNKQIEKRCELHFSRAVGLCSLSVLAKQTSWKIAAFDAIQACGLSGIQWYRHLGNNVKILINLSDQLVTELRSSLEETCKFDENFKLVSEVPQAHLHKNKYTFISLEVCGSAVIYFDAVMSSIKHGGLICLTSTDIAILQNKSPATAQRLYDAKLWKTEYGRELGVRVILANLARAAARWSKGIKVELCAAFEQGFTVVCRVFRGSQFGEKSMTNLQLLAHCQLCQARGFIPDSMYVQENAASPNLCDCSNNGMKPPILQLGPVWSGSLYNQKFLFAILNEMKSMALSSDNIKLIQQLILESACCVSNELESELSLKLCKDKIQKNEEVQSSKKRKLDTSDSISTSLDSAPLSLCSETNIASDGLVSSSTAFYFDVQNHSVKGCNPPTTLSVINKLRAAGFSASKSHFGARCIRTSATLKEFNNIIEQISKATKK